MKELRNIPGITIHELKDGTLSILTDDNFLIRALHKPKKSLTTYDWQLIDIDVEAVPRRSGHFTLRKLISDKLNAKKIKIRKMLVEE